MNVLLAGEDEFTLKFLKVKFEESQFEVDVVSTADAALKLIGEKHFQAIVVDFAMQVQSHFLEGWKILAEKPPVVILSLLKDEADIQKALDFGVSLFINKEHVQMHDIVDVIQKIINGEALPEKSGFRVPGKSAESGENDSVTEEKVVEQKKAVSEPTVVKDDEPHLMTETEEVVEPVVTEKAVQSVVETTENVPEADGAEVVGPNQPEVDVKPTDKAGDSHPHTSSDSETEVVDIDAEAKLTEPD